MERYIGENVMADRCPSSLVLLLLFPSTQPLRVFSQACSQDATVGGGSAEKRAFPG